MPRADEFGPLIESFNSMVVGLRERERIVETFGRHVGKSTADAILRSDPGLGGIEKVITIMFVDLRDFTRRSEQCSPQETVTMLNDFFTVMVTVVERHGGIVNKFLGDGFMALFGVTGETDHPARAVATGCGLLREVARINSEWADRKCAPLAIGVGIHTGPAVVGSIGAPQRMEYTAIGDAVNLASRVEGLTKEVGEPMLFTARTRAALGDEFPAISLPPRAVKGKAELVEIYRLT
jgi:adenylate cyclase